MGLTIQDGKLLLRDGALGTEAACCCVGGCCCVNNIPDRTKTTEEDCAAAGGQWHESVSCDDCPCITEYAQGFGVPSGMACADVDQCGMTQAEAEAAAAAIQSCVDAMLAQLPGLGFLEPYRASTVLTEECPGGGWRVVQDILSPVGLEDDGFYVEGFCCEGLDVLAGPVAFDCGDCGTFNLLPCAGNPLP